MNVLPSRLAIAALGLLFGALACGEATVLALCYGVTFDALLLPTLLGSALALFTSGCVYVYTRTLVRELGEAVSGAGAASGAQAPLLTFEESRALAASLRRPATVAPPPAQRQDQSAASQSDSLALRIRYIASMGHDLRSPLNAMLGFADLLLLDPTAHWSASQQKSISILRERTLDLLSLIDGMIDWARLEARELVPTRVTCAAAPLIERAVASAKEHSGARGLQVSLVLAPQLGSIHADPEQFVRALLGLMDHAVRADKGPQLSISASRQARGPAGEVFVCVEVIDPQLEFRDQDREQLFEAFRPSFAPSGRRIAGMHLGTAVARALMRAQGGDVWFERRPEHGTTFVLTAPVATATSASDIRP